MSNYRDLFREQWGVGASDAGFKRRKKDVYTREIGKYIIEASLNISGNNPMSIFGSLDLRHQSIDRIFYVGQKDVYPQVSRQTPLRIRPIRSMTLAFFDENGVSGQIAAAVHAWWGMAKPAFEELSASAASAALLRQALICDSSPRTVSPALVFLAELAVDPISVWSQFEKYHDIDFGNRVFLSWCNSNRQAAEEVAREVFG